MVRRLGVHPNTLYNWRRTQKGPPWIQVGNMPVYRLDDVIRWEQEQAARDAS
jgi:transposase-like protein